MLSEEEIKKKENSLISFSLCFFIYMCFRKRKLKTWGRGLSLISLSLSITGLHIIYLSLYYQHMAYITNLLQEFAICLSLFHAPLFHAAFSVFMCVCFFHIVLIADLLDKCQLNCILSLRKTCICIYACIQDVTKIHVCFDQTYKRTRRSGIGGERTCGKWYWGRND